MLSYVFDTNVFIKGFDFRAKLPNSQYFTTPGVAIEVKDKASSKYLATMKPFITIKEPSGASIEMIEEFAKQTGDRYSLSKNDIGLIALAYDLSKQKNEDQYLRTKPIPIKVKV